MNTTANPIPHAAANAYSYPLLIKQLLHTALVQAPTQEIVYASYSRYTYTDFYARIQRQANMLTALGVGMGDTVAVMDWDSHRYLEAYFAVPMMGSVLFNVNVRLSPDQILYTINHARPKVLLVNAEFLSVVEGIRDQMESVETVILLNDGEALDPAAVGGQGEYEALLAASADHYDFPDFDENTRATTFYTTGTTGLPKGVFFSHRQLVLHSLSVMAGLGTAAGHGRLHNEDVYMPITPMFHVHAWGIPYIATMMGIKQVYPGRYLPEVLLRLIEKEKVTLSQCVPTILHMLLSHPVGRDMDLSKLKMVIGGSALTQGLAKQALSRGLDVFVGYGMSETCPILTIAHLNTEELKGDLDAQIPLRIKTGQAIPLVNLRIVDGDMSDLLHNNKRTGEVVVRAPWLTQGYLHNPEASAELWESGYLHTNDIGMMDERGTLQITDRLKDVIKTGGEWISSLELESMLTSHPAVNECAVVAVPDEKWGERPLALVVLNPEAGEVTVEMLREHMMGFVAEGHISRWAVPEQIRFVEALTRTSVGKLNKRALREQYTS